MNLTLEYIPDSGIMFGDSFIPWGMTRENVRVILQGVYEINDKVFDGTIYRRDVYTRIFGTPLFLFLNYDGNNQFSEVEMHSGINLSVAGHLVNFDMQFQEAVELLYKVSTDNRLIDRSEVLFIDLKLTLCSAAKMGGDKEDDLLSYMYCAKDITHLLD
jgi:hypothetical protein